MSLTPLPVAGSGCCSGFLLIASFFFFQEHRAHLLGILPFLLILACPLMHFFHHGQAHYDGTATAKVGSTVQSQDVATELSATAV
jgi:hypothetical protein